MNDEKKRPYEVLEKYLAMNEDEFVSHDVVRDCIDPYTGSPLLNGEETPEEKCMKSEDPGFDYDADVSLEAMIIAKNAYLPAMTGFDETWKLVPQESVIVNGENGQKKVFNKEKLKYELVYEVVIKKEYTLRGDTMNTVAATNKEYCRLFKTETLLPLAFELIDLYHTLGNFFLVPHKNGYSVAGARESGPSKGYFDRFLLAVYNFFFGINDYSRSLSSVLKDDDLAGFYKSYLREKFSLDGNLSWNKFIEVNFLQDYVEGSRESGYGKPIEFWSGHFAGKVMPETKGEFILFYETAADRIRKRGQRIYCALQKKKLPSKR